MTSLKYISAKKKKKVYIMQKEKDQFVLGESEVQKGQKNNTQVTYENIFYHVHKKV